MKFILTSFLTLFSFSAFSQSITTFAGDGTPGYLDGPTLTAQFVGPEQTVIDKAGNMYTVDYGNNVIRKITPDSIVSTYAGTGVAGDVDGDRMSAQFNQPLGLAIDIHDNLYVSCGLSHKIKIIRTTGMVETIAGNGTSGFSNGHVSTAQFNLPIYIGVDENLNIYVADRNNHCIRKIDQSKDSVYTFAGTGTVGFEDGAGNLAQFFGPTSVEVGLNGNLIVCDQGNHAIRKIDPQALVTTLAGDGVGGYQDGPGDGARFGAPKGITFDSLGNIYVADRLNFVIRKIDTANFVTTIMGIESISGYLDGEKDVALLGRPVDVQMINNNSLLVSDWSNYVIRKITLTEPTNVSIHSTIQQSTFELYPNPTKDVIRLKGEFGNAFTITIFDAQGKAILEVENKKELNLISLSKGYYFLKISGADFYGIKTLVIE